MKNELESKGYLNLAHFTDGLLQLCEGRDINKHRNIHCHFKLQELFKFYDDLKEYPFLFTPIYKNIETIEQECDFYGPHGIKIKIYLSR